MSARTDCSIRKLSQLSFKTQVGMNEEQRVNGETFTVLVEFNNVLKLFSAINERFCVIFVCTNLYLVCLAFHFFKFLVLQIFVCISINLATYDLVKQYEKNS